MALPKFRVDDNATPGGAGLGYRYVLCVEDPDGEMRPIIERKSNGQDQYLTYKQESVATRKLYEVQHDQQDGIPSAQIVDLAAVAEEAVAEGRRVREERLTGVGLIERERDRQVQDEGWTSDHDDRHREGELARAAAAYAAPFEVFYNPVGTMYEPVWPFNDHWDKRRPRPVGRDDHDGALETFVLLTQPRNDELREERIRELVKAGALIAAEIDRLQRREPR